MRAVILAAGEGQRLRKDIKREKPLINLLGLSLIERNILSLRECGIEDFVIITGCYKKEIEDYLGDGSKYKVHITYLHNPDWKLGNGVSAAAFRKEYRKNEKFILTMADHIFNVEALKSFVHAAASISHDNVLLAADKRLTKVWDVEESTKIESEGNTALKLGKTLKDYDAVDCGVFLGTEVLLNALEEAISKENYNLTDGVNILASQGRVKLHFIKEDWIDVDDLAGYHQAEKILLKSLLPAKDGLISRIINRKLSLPITKMLSKTSITPNQVTLVSLFVALASAISFVLHQPFLGGILAQLSSVLDGVDGEIARLKFQKSNYGGLFDAILDRYADFLIVIGMAWLWFSEGESLTVFFVSAAALTGLPMSMLIKEKYHTVTGKVYIPWHYDGLLKYLPTNRDGRLFIIMLGGILNLVPATLILLAVTTHLQAWGRLINLRKMI
ncbi:MAG: sugar phosphate nucleotidyltransferase [Bacillota bacterium]|jgi:choline kinase/phosphatidylglycerophosphate synthase|nr:NTP transferase domain-containing protein [Clostridia bacterium]